MTKQKPNIPITATLLTVVEKRLALELDDNALSYWPFLKDWLFKQQYSQAIRAMETTEPIKELQDQPVSAVVKLVPALIVSLVIFSFQMLQVRRAPRRVVVFSASSRLEGGAKGKADEFVGCASALEGQDVTSQYYTSMDTLLTAPISWHCHENLILKLLLFLRKPFRKWTSGILPKHDLASAIVAQETNFSKHAVEVAIETFKARVQAYRWLLSLLGVKHIYVISAYTKTDLVYAARSIGISVSEIQHGVLAPVHPSYYYASLGRGWDQALPNKLVVKSSYWEKTQSAFPYAEIVLNPLNTNTMSPEAFKPERPYIVFTGQGLAYSYIKALIDEFLLDPSHESFDFMYICHPKETPQQVSKQLNINEDIHVKITPFVSSVHTMSIIAAAEKHLSVYSSCHFDALELKGATYILRVPEFAYQTDMLEKIEGTHLFTDLEELDLGPIHK